MNPAPQHDSTLAGCVPYIALMAKRPAPKPKANHSWRIYRLRGTPAAFIGIVYAPDEQAAIKKAIEEYGITDPQNQERLIAQRRD
jgi:hypothetical protein